MALDTILEIEKQIRKTLSGFGMQDLQSNISVRFNPDLAMLTSTDISNGTIQLSSGRWATIGDTERLEAIVQETCKFITRQVFGTHARVDGPEWRHIVRRAGIDTKNYRRSMPVNRHRVVCSCGIGSRSNSFLNRLLSGQEQNCDKCGGPIILYCSTQTT